MRLGVPPSLECYSVTHAAPHTAPREVAHGVRLLGGRVPCWVHEEAPQSLPSCRVPPTEVVPGQCHRGSIVWSWVVGIVGRRILEVFGEGVPLVADSEHLVIRRWVCSALSLNGSEQSACCRPGDCIAPATLVLRPEERLCSPRGGFGWSGNICHTPIAVRTAGVSVRTWRSKVSR